jgi:hypothetical protein
MRDLQMLPSPTFLGECRAAERRLSLDAIKGLQRPDSRILDTSYRMLLH